MTDQKQAIANFYERRTPVILTFAFVLTALGGYLASNLQLDSELSRLLPESAQSVQGLERLDDVYARQIGRIAVVVEGPNPDHNERAVESLSTMLGEHHLVESVEAHRPVDFFRDRRLLYLEWDDAKEVADEVQERIKWEKARANPLFADLGSGDPPEVDLSGLEEKYQSKFSNRRYLTDERRRHFVIYVAPEFPNTDFEETGELVDDIESFFERELRPEFSDVDLEFTGRHVKFFEQQHAVRRDLTRGTALALAGILLFLIIYFRGWLYPLVLAAPLVASTIWAFGWAELVFGSLNILTGFLGAVLMGLGIDYGIHLVSRFREARRTEPPKTALMTALYDAGRPSLYAGLTTLIALGSLTYSSFRAFFEFGVLALGGLTLILASYALVLPCLLLLMTKSDVEPDPGSPHDDGHEPVTSGRKTRWTRIAAYAVTFLSMLAVVGVTSVDFQFDFRKLMPQDLNAFQVEDTVDDIVDMAQPPAVVLAEGENHALQIEEELRRRLENDPDAEILGRVFTLYDFVPDKQEEKLELWREIFDEFDAVPKRRRKKSEELKSFYAELERTLENGVVRAEHLPDSIQERFSRTDDPSKTVVLIVPDHYIHDARDALQYVSVTSDLPGPDGEGTVDPISQEALLAEILQHVKTDTLWLILIALSGLLAVTWIAFRNLRRLLFALATVTTGVFVGTGLIGLFGISFNFMNMVIWPIWLGLGVDAVFHLSNRVEHSPTDWSAFTHTSGAVFAAFFTTMIGFGALMISRHRGLESLGQVAVVGLASILVISLALHVFFLRTPDTSEPNSDDTEH